MAHSDGNGNGGWRLIARALYDGAMLVAVITASIWLGRLSERVEKHDTALTTRGAVQISMEADRRITVLEGKVERLEEHQ